MLSRLSAVPSRLSAVPSRLTAVPSRLTAVPSRLTAVPSRLTAVPSRLTAVFVAFDRRSVAFDRRSVAFDRRSVVFDRRSFAFDCRSVAFDRRPVAFDRRSVAFDRRPVALERRSVVFGRDPSRLTAVLTRLTAVFSCLSVKNRACPQDCHDHRSGFASSGMTIAKRRVAGAASRKVTCGAHNLRFDPMTRPNPSSYSDTRPPTPDTRPNPRLVRSVASGPLAVQPPGRRRYDVSRRHLHAHFRFGAEVHGADRAEGEAETFADFVVGEAFDRDQDAEFA